jgi:nucleotide-binding universal stress UspA family protein
VATDFSAGAARAIVRAGQLPLMRGGTISIVHVLPDRLPEAVAVNVEKAAQRRLEQVTTALSESTSALGRRDIKIASVLRRGQAYAEIVRCARSDKADLIVVGRHGLRPVRDMFIGSTAERVIRAGGLPVLIASRSAARSYRRPMIAVDLEDTPRSVVTVALRVLGPGVRLATILHAYHVTFEGFLKPGVSAGEMTALRKEYRQMAASRLAKLQSSLGDLGVRWQANVVYGDARTAILGQVTRHRVDLLTVGTHGRSGLSRALLGSVAEWVIRTAPCDVLVARPVRALRELP